MTTPSKKLSHGKFLAILIIIYILGSLFNIPQAFNPANIQRLIGVVPTWYTPALLFNTALQLVSFIGIWMWKKWAVYLYFVTVLIGVVSIFLIFKDLPPNRAQLSFMFILVLVLVSIGLWSWALSRKWSYFS